MFRTFLLAARDATPQSALNQVVQRVAELYRARFVAAVVRDADHLTGGPPPASSGAVGEREETPAPVQKPTETLILVGDFISAVCDRGHEADLIVVWHSCLADPNGQPSGEQLSKFVREAPRPVWVAREPLRFPERILVAYDGSSHSGRALHMAANLAETVGATLIVLHVDESHDDVAQERILGRAAGYCEPYHMKVERVGLHGSAADSIRDYAESSGCDLLVVGAAGVGYLRGLLFGSVAGRLIATAPCSVLVAK